MERGDMVLRVFPTLPSNFGISNGSLWGMDGHQGECMIGSLVNREILGKSSVARNGNG